MAQYKYSYKPETENMAKAVFRDVAVSSKQVMEICSRIRGKNLEKAKELLEAVKIKKKAIKYTRFTEGAGHKTGMGPGKYPIKAADFVLKALKSAEANAASQGLSKSLKITHISAQRAASPYHYGRQKRRKMKRTTIEVVLKELEQKSVPKKDVKKSSIKTDIKSKTESVEEKQVPETKKEEKKVEDKK